MPTTATRRWTNQKLEPYLFPDEAKTLPVKLAASQSLARGTVLGEKLGTNELQKLTLTGSPTGGSFTVTFASQTTAALAWNSSATDIRDALEALSSIGDGNVKVTGGPIDAAPVLVEFCGSLGSANQAQVTADSSSLTGGSSPTVTPSTVRNGAAGTPGTWTAYDNDNTDGSGQARAILPYDVQVDGSGLITLSGTANQAGGEHGETSGTIPVYISGVFRTTELVGLDARAVADLGRLLSGTVADGVLGVSCT